MADTEGKALVNIVKSIIVNERTKEQFTFETQDEADIKPSLSAGKEDILRVKNRIIAVNDTEDIVIGYEIKMKDNVLSPELLALVEGGTFVNNKYEGPKAGTVVDRDKYTLIIYTEEKEYMDTVGFARFEFRHNKGKAVDYKMKDGTFYVPEFDSKSRPAKGESPVIITFVKEIPETENITTGGTIGGGTNPIVNTTVTSSNSSVSVEIYKSVKWTFADAIDHNDVTTSNFTVMKKSDNSIVAGAVTIDSTNKIVTFVPNSLEANTIYVASAKAVDSVSGTGTTTAITTEFTTING